VQPAGELFTLPPAPDELAEAREREAKRTARARELRALAVEAWRRVPQTFRAPVPELLRRLEHERAGVPGRRLLGKLREARTVAALLSGPTGCGKTTAAAVLVWRALAEFEQSDGERCACATELVWTTAIDLAVAERRHALGQGEPELLAKARRCGLLVLDDLGLEEPNAVFPILSARYDECRATVVTTGLTKAGLTKHLGAAGVRRVVEQHVETAVLVADCHDPVKARPVNP
jgi:DNA polymerase III delta prime subunit